MNFKKLYKAELRRLFLHCEEECLYYNKENNTCQSKKCTMGDDGYVTFWDRLFCESNKGETERRINDSV